MSWWVKCPSYIKSPEFQYPVPVWWCSAIEPALERWVSRPQLRSGSGLHTHTHTFTQTKHTHTYIHGFLKYHT